MQRFWIGWAALAVMSACSDGNPFDENTDPTDPEVPEIPVEDVPEVLRGDLTSFSYDPATDTLIVSGLSLDDTPFEAEYRRRPELDVPGYEAYTSQDGSLDRHTTAFVAQREGVTGGITVTGGQFSYFFGGSSYGRQGDFRPPESAPDSGMVTYAGTYAGLLNVAGDGDDLLPVANGTPNDVRPVQAAEVTGQVLINADFTDNQVNGIVFNRVIPDADVSVANLELSPSAIDDSGRFVGDVTQNVTEKKGDFGGVFGGEDASAVAGTLYVQDHIETEGDGTIQEYGVFVLSGCGTANADALCDQPSP